METENTTPTPTPTTSNPNPWRDNWAHMEPMDRFEQAARIMGPTDRAYTDVRAESETMGEWIAEMADRYANATGQPVDATAERFQRDCFAAFFQNRLDESGYGAEMNRRLLAMVAEDDRYASVRDGAAWDEVLAGLAAMEIGGKAWGAVTDEAAREMQRAEAAKRHAEQMRQQAEAARQAAAEAEANQSPDADQANQDAADAQAQADQAQAQADQIQAHADEVWMAGQRAVRRAVAEATESAEGTIQAVRAIGKAAGVGGAPMRSADVLEMVDGLDMTAVRQLADMVGSMVRLAAEKQAHKLEHDAGAIVDINFGDDLSKVVDDELALLAHPALKLDAAARLADSALMEFELEERTPQGRGPLVVCADFSGSMHGHNEAMTRAFIVALATIAKAQGRSMAVVPFAHQIGDVIRFERGTKDAEWAKRIQAVLRLSAGGGTSFDPPLSEAIRIITGDEVFERADIVFLTDGHAPLSDSNRAAVNAMRQTAGLSVLTVLVGGGYAAKGVLEPISDRIWEEAEFSGHAAGGVFATL